MAGQGPKSTYNASKVPGQAQMVRERDDSLNQSFDSHSQGQATNFLQETGTQVKNIAHGATDVGKGAAQGAVSLAQGAALGAANIAQGAADSIKNTLGMNSSSRSINTVGGATVEKSTTINCTSGNNTNRES